MLVLFKKPFLSKISPRGAAHGCGWPCARVKIWNSLSSHSATVKLPSQRQVQLFLLYYCPTGKAPHNARYYWTCNWWHDIICFVLVFVPSATTWKGKNTSSCYIVLLYCISRSKLHIAKRLLFDVLTIIFVIVFCRSVKSSLSLRCGWGCRCLGSFWLPLLMWPAFITLPHPGYPSRFVFRMSRHRCCARGIPQSKWVCSKTWRWPSSVNSKEFFW